MTKLSLFLLIFVLLGCHKKAIVTPEIDHSEFHNEHKVTLIGYQSDAMEPFISKDGNYLFFNNKTGSTNKDIFYAEARNETTFVFKGAVLGVNTRFVDATPSLDDSNHFYFMSTRSLDSTNQTLFCGDFLDGTVTNVHRLKGTVNNSDPYWIHMGAAISWNGNWLFVSNAKFTHKGQFDFQGNIRLATKIGERFDWTANEGTLLAAINTRNATQYAPELSSDGLELFYSEVERGSPPVFRLFYSKRENSHAAFGKPIAITDPFKHDPSAIVEAPTLSGDGRRLYYHKKEDKRFSIFMLSRE